MTESGNLVSFYTGNPVYDGLVTILASRHSAGLDKTAIERLHESLVAVANKEPGGLRFLVLGEFRFVANLDANLGK